jgi:hypothetical protein
MKRCCPSRNAAEWNAERSCYAPLLLALDYPGRRFDAEAVHLLFCRIVHPRFGLEETDLIYNIRFLRPMYCLPLGPVLAMPTCNRRKPGVLVK